MPHAQTGVRARPERDTIRIGPGDFATDGDDPEDEAFHFVGVGAGTFEAFDPATHTRIGGGLRLTADGSSVRHLRIDGGWRAGLALRTSGGPRSYVVEDALLVGSGTPTEAGGLEIEGQGIEADLRRSVVRTASSSTAKVAAHSNGATLRAEDSTFDATDGGTAVHAGNQSILSLTRSVANGRGYGVIADNSAVTVDRSRVTGRIATLQVRGALESSSMTVTDSLITVDPAAYSDAAVRVTPSGAGRTSTATIRGSTLLLANAIGQAAIHMELDKAGTGVLDLQSSVVRASHPDIPDVRVDGNTGTAQVSASSSSFTDVVGLPSLAPGAGTNVAGDPMLGAAATRRDVRWTLSEAAATKIRIQKRVRRDGRARWVTVRRISAAAMAGPNSARILGKLKPGRYRASISAVDAAGNVATGVKAGFRVRSAG